MYCGTIVRCQLLASCGNVVGRAGLEPAISAFPHKTFVRAASGLRDVLTKLDYRPSYLDPTSAGNSYPVC